MDGYEKTEHLNTNITNMLHMSQKCYKLEIVNRLLKKESHIRSLAKTLGTNQMMISRRINELVKENVADYRTEGKNKVFFLKKTIEARNYALTTEHYKLNKTLKKYPHLRRIIKKIQENKKINLTILFGSYAKRLAKKDSDIDIYIETKNKKIKQDLERLDSKLSVKIGKYDKTNLLIKEIEKNHVIIKGVEDYFKNNQFFD